MQQVSHSATPHVPSVADCAEQHAERELAALLGLSFGVRRPLQKIVKGTRRHLCFFFFFFFFFKKAQNILCLSKPQKARPGALSTGAVGPPFGLVAPSLSLLQMTRKNPLSTYVFGFT